MAHISVSVYGKCSLIKNNIKDELFIITLQHMRSYLNNNNELKVRLNMISNESP